LTLAKRATALGWFYSNGKPNTTRVNTTLATLVGKNRALITEEGKGYAINDATGVIVYGPEE
jgi:hypothetical protein